MTHCSAFLKRLACAIAVASLVLTSAPIDARADDHGEAGHDASHGPMPVAIIGGVVSSAFWLVSLPFCALIAPKHIGDSFDLMVAAPFRATVGAER
ncbi:MAG: hypothetical protein R3F35_08680 [Myxococcota bacterium]